MARIFLLDPEKFTEDFAIQSEVEQRLPVIKDKYIAYGINSRNTSISGYVKSPTTARMDVERNEDQTPDHTYQGSAHNAPTMPCMNESTQPQSKVFQNSLSYTSVKNSGCNFQTTLSYIYKVPKQNKIGRAGYGKRIAEKNLHLQA